MASPIVFNPNWRAAHPETSSEECGGADPTLARRALALLSHFELAERLVQVWIHNQRNLNRLKELGAMIGEADRRLDSSKPGRRLVEARRERLLAERSATLLQLRVNERLASALVDEIEARRRAAGERPHAVTA